MYRQLLVLLLCCTVIVPCISAQELDITSFDHDGTISWSNTVTGGEYGVIWASSPDGPWQAGWDNPGMILATGTTASTTVPLFYRVVRWPTEGLVAYYPFTTGPDDQSTNGFTSVATAVTQVLDRSGNSFAYSFDGTNSYIDCGDHALFDLTNGLTVAGWFKTTKTNGYPAAVSKFDADGGYYLRVYGNYIAFCINNATYVSAVLPITNEWRFVAGTWKSYDTRLYLDGEQVDDHGYPFSMRPPSYPLLIGCRHDTAGPNSPFGGLIDDVRIYDHALSPEEIWALYHYQP